MESFDIDNPNTLVSKLAHTRRLINAIATTYDKPFKQIVENYLADID
jgi:hypothetical protein